MTPMHDTTQWQCYMMIARIALKTIVVSLQRNWYTMTKGALFADNSRLGYLCDHGLPMIVLKKSNFSKHSLLWASVTLESG